MKWSELKGPSNRGSRISNNFQNGVASSVVLVGEKSCGVAAMVHSATIW